MRRRLPERESYSGQTLAPDPHTDAVDLTRGREGVGKSEEGNVADPLAGAVVDNCHILVRKCRIYRHDPAGFGTAEKGS